MLEQQPSYISRKLILLIGQAEGELTVKDIVRGVKKAGGRSLDTRSIRTYLQRLEKWNGFLTYTREKDTYALTRKGHDYFNSKREDIRKEVQLDNERKKADIWL